MCCSTPVGIIQKNKDWNTLAAHHLLQGILKPVGIIQKNKDWNDPVVLYILKRTFAGRHHPEEQGLKLDYGPLPTEEMLGR